MAVSVSVGVVNFRTYGALTACLRSLRGQTKQPACISLVDNGAIPAEAERVRAEFPEVAYRGTSENHGFARAANEAIEAASPTSDVLILNADVRLDPRFIERIQAFDADPRAGLLGGRLERPNGDIDSVGIGLRRSGRSFDLCPPRGEVPTQAFEVFAVSGAAIYLRRACLDDLVQAHGEYFDASFWLYHEEVDLAWRARLRGWTCWTVPGAVAEHDRGWKSGNRRQVPLALRRASWRNFALRMVKNTPASVLAAHAPWIISSEIVRFGHALLRERELLPAYAMALRALPEAWRKRQRILATQSISPAQVRAWHTRGLPGSKTGASAGRHR